MESDSELMRRVRKIAGHIHQSIPPNSHVDLDDLVQDGMIGLLDAKQRYDPQKGENFMTFASARIEGAIRDGMRSQDWCGRSARTLMKQVLRATTKLTKQLGREPTSEEAAAEANLSLDEFHKARALWHSSTPISLSAPVAALAALDGGATIADTIVDDRRADGFEMVVLKEHKTLLHDAFRKLNAKERQAVWLYHFDTNEYTLEEVAQFMRIGASRVSQLCTNARKKLGVELQKHREFVSSGKDRGATHHPEQTKLQRAPGDTSAQPRAATLHAAPSASTWSTRVGVA
jgi:RNA polymerase sigma factor for flagellar operon FliA